MSRSAIPLRVTAMLVVALLFPGIGTGRASAQGAIELAGRPTCEDCEIRFEPLVRLGAEEGGGVVCPQLDRVVRDDRNRYFVVGCARKRLQVFDEEGKFLRVVPAADELSSAPFITLRFPRLAPDGALVLFGSRHVAHLARDLAVRRFHRRGVGIPSDAIVLSGQLGVLAADIRTPERVGQPLHVTNLRGEIVRSFGETGRAYRVDDALGMRRHLSRVSEKRFWSGHDVEYRLDLWNIEGRREQTLVRSLPWFPAERANASPDPADWPHLMAVRRTADAKLWLILRPPDGDVASYGRNVVELIDLASMRVEASTSIPYELFGWIDDHIAYTWGETERGIPAIQVLEATIVRHGALAQRARPNQE